jgi:uncharacterized protein YegP (UPF0339 family)
MPTSTLRDRVSATLVAFAWDEWAQMGVLASPHRESRWAQDPEALLVFTLEVARDDPRLFDEVLDWLVLNEPLVSSRRLRAMCEDTTDERLVEAALTWVGQRRGRARSSTKPRTSQPPEQLFRGVESPIQRADEAFAAFGFLRPRAIPSKKSQPPDLDRPINFAFRLRQLLGLSARAEVVRYLLTFDAPWATASVIARSAGYAKRNVQEALTSLHAAHVISGMVVGTEQRYSVEHTRWADFLGMGSLPTQRDWPQLLGGLRRILRWLGQEELDDMSTYMRASRARDLLEEVGPDFAYAGIPVRFGNTPDEAWNALTETIEHGVLAVSGDEPAETPTSPHERHTLHRFPASFEIYRSRAGTYHWRVRAANGQIIAESGDNFRSQAAALRAARHVRERAGELQYDVVEEAPGMHRWRAYANGRVLAVSGDAFTSRSNATRAAARVRQIAPQAGVATDTG